MKQPLWTPSAIAEDLVAQVGELLTAGASPAALVAALVREGIEARTAWAMVRELAARHERTRHEPDVLPDADGQSPGAGEAVYGVDTTLARQWLRRLGPCEPPAALAAALQASGLSAATASALATEWQNDCARLDLRQELRLRRLGVQGMAAGGLFTLYFAGVALNGFVGPGRGEFAGDEAPWNALTASFTAAMTLYSAALWWRHRHARVEVACARTKG